jgi:hypothetical protein
MLKIGVRMSWAGGDRLLIFLSLLFLRVASADVRVTVRGVVYAQTRGAPAPIPDAMLTAGDKEERPAYSRQDGSYELNLRLKPHETATVRVDHDGYKKRETPRIGVQHAYTS